MKTGQSDCYWTNVGSVTPGKNIFCQITVKNTGSRAAFMKALCFSGNTIKRKSSLKKCFFEILIMDNLLPFI